MTTALIQSLCSVVALGAVILIFRIDDARQGVRIAGGVRTRFDRVVTAAAQQLHRVHLSYGQGVIQLMYHYAVNALLVRTLHSLAALQHWMERQMRQNRQTARRITRTKTARNHLDDLQDHKEATTLSEAQKAKLRSLD